VEIAVAAYLMMRGWLILPVYDYSGLGEGKPPKLTARESEDSLICPDLLCAKNGLIRWCEVKYKERCDWTRVVQRRETGINKRLWEHYQQVEQATGIATWIVFAHGQENELRRGLLSLLARPGHHRLYLGDKMGKDGMVFFSYDELSLICPLSDIIDLSTITGVRCQDENQS